MCGCLGTAYVSCKGLHWNVGRKIIEMQTTDLAAAGEESSNANRASVYSKLLAEQWQSMQPAAQGSQVSLLFPLWFVVYIGVSVACPENLHSVTTSTIDSSVHVSYTII